MAPSGGLQAGALARRSARRAPGPARPPTACGSLLLDTEHSSPRRPSPPPAPRKYKNRLRLFAPICCYVLICCCYCCCCCLLALRPRCFQPCQCGRVALDEAASERAVAAVNRTPPPTRVRLDQSGARGERKQEHIKRKNMNKRRRGTRCGLGCREVGAARAHRDPLPPRRQTAQR